MIRETGIFVVVMLWLPAQLPAQGEHVSRRQDATFQCGMLNAECGMEVESRLTNELPGQFRIPHSAFRIGTWRRATVHYGKWLTGASAVALTWMGAHEHARSTDAWDALSARCRTNSANCSLGPDGRYVSALSEEYYQRSLRYDRRARTRLLAGQGALLLTIGFFLLDRGHGDGGPPNIPFPSLDVSGDPQAGDARVGLRFAF